MFGDGAARAVHGAAPGRHHRRCRAGPTGTIFYAKAQLAADLDVTLRRYAKVDPTFPNYSTARLFLRDDQFKSLVALGRAAGARLTPMVGDACRSP